MQKVKIKALTNLGTNDYPSCPIQEGDTAEVPPEVAAKLVANRHGVIVDLPPEKTDAAPVESIEEKVEPEAEVEQEEVRQTAKPSAKPNAKK